MPTPRCLTPGPQQEGLIAALAGLTDAILALGELLEDLLPEEENPLPEKESSM